MAGCSVVFIMLLFCWPAMLVYALVSIVAVAAAEFVTSAAFPCLVGSIVLSALAAADVARIVWRRVREGEGFPFERRMLVRPVVLGAVAFALLVAMCVIAGNLVLQWWQGAPA